MLSPAFALLIFLVWSCSPLASALDPCPSTPCLNGGSCVANQCQCSGYYLGEFCEIAGPCTQEPCEYGQCLQSGAASYTCSCYHGFQGQNCDVVDPCGNLPCEFGSCYSDGTSFYNCTCYPGFSGYDCQDYDPCYSNPCETGTCISDGFYSYFCDASDPCISSPCQNGLCKSESGAAVCECFSGFSGQFCEILDPCPPSYCYHGQCRVENGTSVCDCFSGFGGERCGIPQCTASSCKNGGACLNNPTGFICDCTGTGFQGPSCQTQVVAACLTTHPCLNGGVCRDKGTSNFTCNCTGTGFTGPTCSQVVTCSAANPEFNAIWPTVIFWDYARGTCVAGFIGEPMRQCLTTGLFGPVLGPCIEASTQCPAETYASAVWPATYVNHTATGACLPGYAGTSTRKCLLNGSWDTTLAGFCTIKQCAAVTEGNATWPSRPAGATVNGACISGFTGRPFRVCLESGDFGPITNPCVPMGIECAQESYGNALWSTTKVGLTATGTCKPGYAGTPLRDCGLDGQWKSLIQSHCVRIPCPEVTEGNANWNVTQQNTRANGVCAAGYIGSPYRLCGALGVWEAIVEPCGVTSNCPAGLYARANWQETPFGQTATGSCIAGWTGTPKRICKPNGLWQDLVSNHCIRI